MKLLAHSSKDSLLILLLPAQLALLVFGVVSFGALPAAATLGLGAILVFVACMNFQCTAHNFIHCPFFVRKRWNQMFSIGNSLGLGIPQSLYRVHHLNHHKYGNDAKDPKTGTTRDLSSTYRYSRHPDREESIFGYALLGSFRTGVGSLLDGARKNGSLRLTALETAALILFVLLLFVLDHRGAIFFYLPVWYLGQAAAHAENFLEHHGAIPGSRLTDSVSCYGRLYNLLWFNNGYHQEHHFRPQVHWSRLRELRTAMLPESQRRVVEGAHWFNFNPPARETYLREESGRGTAARRGNPAPSAHGYDVIVVGASVGGSAAAALFGRRGLRVALVERRARPDAYKSVCTHFIQPSAVPALERLGAAAAIEAAGGVRNRLEVWTRWGWIRGEETGDSYGYNVRREKLDPILRSLAAGTTGVELLSGRTADRLLFDGERVVGVEISRRSSSKTLLAPLVVAADGRHSHLAALAGAPASVRPNRRFVYYAYFRGLELRAGANSQYWHLTPNLAYAFRNDDDTTLVGVFLPLSELSLWKADLVSSFHRFWKTVPGAPDLDGAERISEMRGLVEMDNVRRPAAWRAMALVGDAALSLDPIWGTGLGFALQSSEWLVEASAEAVARRAGLDRALESYRRTHLRETRGHAVHIADFSKVRPNRLFEDLLLSGAARDPELARSVLAYFGREVGIGDVVRPRNFLRAIRASFGAMLEARPSPDEPAEARARQT
jgi:flavin-dependent dehydrogenase/fatty acid desaturase